MFGVSLSLSGLIQKRDLCVSLAGAYCETFWRVNPYSLSATSCHCHLSAKLNIFFNQTLPRSIDAEIEIGAKCEIFRRLSPPKTQGPIKKRPVVWFRAGFDVSRTHTFGCLPGRRRETAIATPRMMPARLATRKRSCATHRVLDFASVWKQNSCASAWRAQRSPCSAEKPPIPPLPYSWISRGSRMHGSSRAVVSDPASCDSQPFWSKTLSFKELPWALQWMGLWLFVSQLNQITLLTQELHAWQARCF